MKKSIPKLNAVKYTTHDSSSLDYTMVTNNSVVYIFFFFFRLFITKIYSNIKKEGKTAKKFEKSLSAYLAPAGTSNGFGTWGRGGGGRRRNTTKNNNIADVELLLLKKNTEAVNFAFGRRHATLIDFPTRRYFCSFEGKAELFLSCVSPGHSVIISCEELQRK